MSKSKENPNGGFFTLRRKFAILGVAMIVTNCLFMNTIFVIALIKTSFDSKILFYCVAYNAFLCGICILYLIVYSLIVFFHDIGFEKIEKIGKYVADFKK